LEYIKKSFTFKLQRTKGR